MTPAPGHTLSTAPRTPRTGRSRPPRRSVALGCLLPWLLLTGTTTVRAVSPELLPLVTPLESGIGLLPQANPASGPALVVTGEFLISGDQQSPAGREGAVHVWKKSGDAWIPWQTLQDQGPNLDPNAGWFGYCLDLSGDWLAVGSTHAHGEFGEGDVQLFHLDPETRQFEFAQYIQAPEVGHTAAGAELPDAADEFGDAISIDRNWLFISAPWHDHGNLQDSGAVWCYERQDNQWIERQILVGADVVPGDGNHTRAWDNFGISVKVSGSEAFVSDKYNNAGSYASGTVYLYSLDHGSWHQTGVLRPDVPLGGGSFGACICARGDDLVITAPMRQSPVTIGSIYFFRRQQGAWKQVFTYTPDNTNGGENFGTALALSGNLAVTGTKYANGKVGSLHVFRRDNEGAPWAFDRSLTPPSCIPGSLFGTDVCTDGREIHATAPGLVIPTPAGSAPSTCNRIFTYLPAAPVTPPGITGVQIDPHPVGSSIGVSLRVTGAAPMVLQSSLDMLDWQDESQPLPAGDYAFLHPRDGTCFFRLRNDP